MQGEVEDQGEKAHDEAAKRTSWRNDFFKKLSTTYAEDEDVWLIAAKLIKACLITAASLFLKIERVYDIQTDIKQG